MEEGRARSCRRAACSRWRPASSSQRERERMAFRSAELLGRRPPNSTPACPTRRRSRRRSRPRWSPSTAGAWPPDATSTRLGAVKQARRGAGARRGRRRRRWPAGCAGASSTVSSVEEKPYTRRPYPPFMTSTLQQEAGPQAAVLLGAHHEHRAAAVRERLHHLHAYRLDDAVASRRSTRPARRPASCTATSTSTRRRASTPAR